MSHQGHMFFILVCMGGLILGGGPLYGEAYRIKEGVLEDLIPLEVQGKGTPDTLVMSPGIYAINGPSYDCREEGLYRFYTVGSASEQRLVFTEKIDNLMESISWLVCHGFKDDAVDFSTALQRVKNRRLQMTCGSIANFTIALLSMLGVQSRFVLLLTLHPWNSYNNGHSIIEVLDGGRWVAWDIDFRNRFETDGKRLNALELKDAVVDGGYELVKFSLSPLLALGNLSSNTYNYEFHYERNFLFEEKLRWQYKKCAQVILIRKKGTFYFTCEPAMKARVETYDNNFVFMEEEEFVNAFYKSK